MKSTINLSVIDWAAIVIVVVGAINWGLIGLAHFLTDAANWNVVNQLVAEWPALEFGIYVLVGLAALWTVYLTARLAGMGRTTPASELEAEPRT